MKRFIMILVLLDNLISNSAKRIFISRWVLTGKCRQCGTCCRKILLKMTPAQMRSRLFTAIAVRWITWLFDFIPLGIDRENNYLIFTCKHLTAEGKCGNYFWRPNVCRNYPLVDYFEEPRLLPGCGFQAKLR